MPRKGTEVVDVAYERIKLEREKAILFVIGGKDVWFPKSQIELDRDAKTSAMEPALAEEKEVEGSVV